MAEELAFEQGCRQGRTVDGHKGFVSSTARQMNCFGDYFLARTTLTLQKYSGFGAGDARDHIQDPSHSFAFRDNIRKIVSFLYKLFEPLDLGVQSAVFQGSFDL